MSTGCHTKPGVQWVWLLKMEVEFCERVLTLFSSHVEIGRGREWEKDEEGGKKFILRNWFSNAKYAR